MTRDELLEKLDSIIANGMNADARASLIRLAADVREEGVLDIQQPPAVNDQRWFYSSWDDSEHQCMGPYDAEHAAVEAALNEEHSHFFVFPLIGKIYEPEAQPRLSVVSAT